VHHLRHETALPEGGDHPGERVLGDARLGSEATHLLLALPLRLLQQFGVPGADLGWSERGERDGVQVRGDVLAHELVVEH
jgi:hypothetical protein